MLKPLSFQLSCGGNVVTMLDPEICKGYEMWNTMHKLDYIAEDAVINKRPLNLVVKFMEEELTSEDERVYFLQAYTKSLKSEWYQMGYDEGYNDAY